ncbi:MAG: hypothetical protein LBH44_01925 [Treponema sp.]|jgi:hypothetical protein|nr:hypothetical protein [Treponema sp.]
MPLPLILGIGAAAAAALGIGKGVKAYKDNKKAKRVNQDAEELIEEAKETLETARKFSSGSLEILGRKKVFTLDNNMVRFIKVFKKIKNIDVQDSIGLDELKKFRIDSQSFTELRELSGYASSIASGIVGGAVGGALAAFGAYSGTMTFAAASTGTAIATLSGAAATNATLAFLGGGSLAAGGLGIAGGMAVLGGLIAGPALAIMGFFIGAKASKNLDNAYSNMAEAEKIAEELETASFLCNSIRRRSYMFHRLLVRLDILFLRLNYELEQLIKKHGRNYRKYKTEQKHTVAQICSVAGAIKAVLDTPLLTEDGCLTPQSETLAIELQSKVPLLAQG